ncbi:MAG: histidine--tRNA ligase [Ruminococcaceae bacterium]|nr:histidine--tRNA ligase [Oscillospiraceae bacterium]
MSNTKTEPRVLQGTMELLPPDQILFNKMYDTIREVYESFGFLPLDTPVLEYSNVLLAKAGGETEKQIYRFTKGDTDLSMRFDLTVPLARYVALHKNDLVFPFKRYQMGKVYRGERPQKGRFREFYQCDIDIIGAEALDLMYDAEMPAVIYNVFTKLNFGEFVIRINNRKVLNGFFSSLGLADKIGDILRTIDKLEKIGTEKVMAELGEFGVDGAAADKILSFISIKGTNREVLDALCAVDCADETFKEGVAELEKVVSYAYMYGIPEKNIAIDLTIARGLDYYTGTVYETKLVDYPSLGSVCSGGRYDNLTGYYTDDSLPGIGISIGLTRLFSQLRSENIISDDRNSLVDVLFIPMDKNHIDFVLESAAVVRNAGLKVDVYCLDKGMKPKMKFANRSGIPYVALVGDSEAEAGKVMLKDMTSGEQELLTPAEVAARLAK